MSSLLYILGMEDEEGMADEGGEEEEEEDDAVHVFTGHSGYCYSLFLPVNCLLRS